MTRIGGDPADAHRVDPVGFPSPPASAAPWRPSFPGEFLGEGGWGAGRGRGGAGPAAAYKEGRLRTAATRLRALCRPRRHGPRPPARAPAAPRGRPRRRRGVGRCSEMPPRGRTSLSFVPGSPGSGEDRGAGWGSGVGGAAPSPRSCRGRRNFVGNLAPTEVPGRPAPVETGGSSACRAPPPCCSSRLPSASAPLQAPGSDVTKPVSPYPPRPPLLPSPHLPW